MSEKPRDGIRMTRAATRMISFFMVSHLTPGYYSKNRARKNAGLTRGAGSEGLWPKQVRCPPEEPGLTFGTPPLTILSGGGEK
jgi:hypothetical protein